MLLHDVVEDCGGAPELQKIKETFGARVAGIVEACSDTDQKPKPAWCKRKKRYLAHLRHADPSVLRVSLADKLHNARAILLDYRELGERLWSRFDPESNQPWYYRELAKIFSQRSKSALAEELERAVSQLEELIGQNPSDPFSKATSSSRIQA